MTVMLQPVTIIIIIIVIITIIMSIYYASALIGRRH